MSENSEILPSQFTRPRQLVLSALKKQTICNYIKHTNTDIHYNCPCCLNVVHFLSAGLSPSEGGAHRRAGGGAEGKRSDHRRAGGGARPGGAGTHTGRETGTLSPAGANKHTNTSRYCVSETSAIPFSQTINVWAEPFLKLNPYQSFFCSHTHKRPHI